MYIYTYNVGGFEQGGFYVDNGQEYDSETEIRSEWLNCGRIFTFTVETDYKWSFICRDSSGNFIHISDAYNYKTSGTKINLSEYPNVSDIRIELHDTNGINPPATCTVIIEFAWIMGANGKPTNEYLPDSSDLPENPLTQPYPKTMWRIVDGKPTHDFLPNLPENPLTQPYPKTMWRIDKSRNNGKPYHEYLPDSIDLGAFANATNLTYVRIPPTVKKIGRYSFRNTKLTSVTIASDCEYYDTSFPDGCQIKFY